MQYVTQVCAAVLAEFHGRLREYKGADYSHDAWQTILHPARHKIAISSKPLNALYACIECACASHMHCCRKAVGPGGIWQGHQCVRA